ncbi:hypothetical protein K1719_044610 [Acacia pycnantha]|nr:hypothetical protein K1719_044610 [Acacia pycnantha]
MAEAMIEVALETLSSLIHKELVSFLGVDREMRKLSSILTTIKAVLEDAEEKQITDKALKNWLRKLRDAGHLLDDILDEYSTHALSLECQDKTSHERRNQVMEWRQTTSIITQPQFYGREVDKEKIVAFLVGDDASNLEDVSVYPITGIGGLGKTTLAQQVFHDRRAVDHFELRIWVCVSEDFNMKRISKAIIDSTWACLRRFRSRTLTETTSRGVHQFWSLLVLQRLLALQSFLPEDDCWELFRQGAFGLEMEERVELVAIGKEIVKKCKGVPLAAKTLGSLLRFQSDEKDWLHIKEMFPKDHTMSKKRVIELWMANAFISTNEECEVEDVGDRVWNELYLRSFFEDVEIREWDQDTVFKMHDLIHDLAQFVMEEECCTSTFKSSPHELRNLKLEGSLHIRHLERVRSLTDAKEANLADKHLNELVLSWERNEESQSEENDEHILEDLQPHSQLKSLLIGGYFGTQFPRWMDNESYDDGVARGFNNLKFLSLEKLPNLVKLSRADGDIVFPCLSTLHISHCPKLILPCLQRVTELIMLKESNGDLLASIQNLHNLERLWFIKDKDLISFPNGMLGELQISRCENLETLTEQALQGLHSLKRLTICRYAKFKLSAGFRYLTALEDLTIEGCPEVEHLPEALQHAMALQSLGLYDLPNIAFFLTGWETLELVKRCKDETGEDWPKIAHVSKKIQIYHLEAIVIRVMVWIIEIFMKTEVDSRAYLGSQVTQPTVACVSS